MAMRLPKQAFLALAAVAWSDGRLAPDEAAALLRAAEACGVTGVDLAMVERATKEHVGIEDVPTDELTPFDAAATYALASWIARIDGVVKPEEHLTLLTLAEHLGLEPKAREAAAGCAFDIAMLKTPKYDFEALIARLRERLPTLVKLSAPPNG